MTTIKTKAATHECEWIWCKKNNKPWMIVWTKIYCKDHTHASLFKIKLVSVQFGGKLSWNLKELTCAKSIFACHCRKQFYYLELYPLSQDYISVKEKFAKYLPHSAGRYQVKRFRKAQCPIVERLACSLMMHGRNNGKKLMAVRIVKHSFEIIHLLTGEVNWTLFYKYSDLRLCLFSQSVLGTHRHKMMKSKIKIRNKKRWGKNEHVLMMMMIRRIEVFLWVWLGFIFFGQIFVEVSIKSLLPGENMVIICMLCCEMLLCMPFHNKFKASPYEFSSLIFCHQLAVKQQF